MTTMCQHHKKLTNGKGKCSVPMWVAGMPAGFCDKDAFGEPSKDGWYKNRITGGRFRLDGRYDGYVPGLACAGHGGPQRPNDE
jgi:hypothetical protein